MSDLGMSEEGAQELCRQLDEIGLKGVLEQALEARAMSEAEALYEEIVDADFHSTEKAVETLRAALAAKDEEIARLEKRLTRELTAKDKHYHSALEERDAARAALRGAYQALRDAHAEDVLSEPVSAYVWNEIREARRALESVSYMKQARSALGKGDER